MLTGKVLGDILDADAKEAHLREFARQHGASQEQIIAMGDGANDLKMLGIAGFPVATTPSRWCVSRRATR